MFLLLWFNSILEAAPSVSHNQHPLFMITGSQGMRSSELIDSVSITLNHSSVFEKESSANYSADIDLEVTVVDISFTKKISSSVELGMSLPLISYSRGFLDGVLANYHNSFGIYDSGRSKHPNNQFNFKMQKNGNDLFRASDGETSMGDITLGLKQNIADTQRTILSFYYFVDLPTGDAGRGFGNGNLDPGIAILLNNQIYDKFNTYMNLGAVWPGCIEGEYELCRDQFLYSSLFFEWMINDKNSLMGGLSYEESGFDTKISIIDADPVLFNISYIRQLKQRRSLTIFLLEDIATTSAPDFTLGVRINFGS